MIKEKFFWIDCLRVLASFGVVLMHIAAPLLSQYGEVSSSDWWTSNFYCNFMRFRIPIFLMITGALILPKTYNSINEYLGKRVVRIVYPFLFWSVIYLVRQTILLFLNGHISTIEDVLKFTILEMKTGAAFHFWYIYLLLGLYLFFPILIGWLKKCAKSEIKYFICIWAVTIIASWPLINIVFPNIELRYFSGFIGFPVLGYFLMKNTYINANRVKIISILLILAGTLTTMIGTFILSKQKGTLSDALYGHLSPSVIISAIGIFLLFKYFNFQKRAGIFSSLILFFSKYSYGIYLSHILILWMLSDLGINHSFINPILGIPLAAILCFTLSALLVWGINKLPLGKYISG